MIPEVGYAICCLLQGIAAFFQLKDRCSEEGKMSLSKNRDSFIAAILVVGAVVSAGFAVWIYDHPPKPQIVTVEKIVEKQVQIPCPTTQQITGNARAHGKGAIAHSGNGDTINQKP